MTNGAPEDRSEELTNLVNASGFAFQIAVEHQIRRLFDEQGGGEIVPEHPWRDRQTGEEGFIDLVLRRGMARIVIECKRTQDATWVFLQPSRERQVATIVQCRWFQGGRGQSFITGADRLRVIPDSPEAAFCTIRGSGETDRSLLERLGTKLVKSVDCLADEELGLSGEEEGIIRFYLPMIVTTARLVVCGFDPQTVSLADGLLGAGDYYESPLVRFRKTLSTGMLEGVEARSIADANRAKERTVLVVNAPYLPRFLQLLDVRASSPWHPLPWEHRRRTGDGAVVRSPLD